MTASSHYPVGGVIPPHWHHLMLLDRRRCLGFERAIERAVRPGDVVLDAGAGTGLLSFFAARTARRVHAIEADPAVAALGARLIALNGLAGRVAFAHGRAEDAVQTEPVDVVLCEMLHVGLAVEQQVAVLNALHGRLAEAFPGHPYRVVPAEAVHYCQLLEADFDFYGYRAPMRRLGDPYQADPTIRPLSALTAYAQTDFGRPSPSRVTGACRLEASQTGRATAVRVLTQAVLSYDETLPAEERLVDWYLNYLVIPLDEPLEARPGRGFRATIDYAAGCALEEIDLTIRPE